MNKHKQTDKRSTVNKQSKELKKFNRYVKRLNTLLKQPYQDISAPLLHKLKGTQGIFVSHTPTYSKIVHLDQNTNDWEQKFESLNPVQNSIDANMVASWFGYSHKLPVIG